MAKKINMSNDDPVIYCGPSIPKFGLVQFAIYRGNLPENVNNAAVRIEEIKKVIIPIHRLNAFRRELAKIGSEAHRLYNSIVEQAKEREI
ncbi:hypothetical protein [Cloacibacillus porcorum]|uniref:hypothetical protein n=1 Tax=Cloacibacillus porcorum TaxID=1197717 RepID=UPI002672284D|nr:hypothetical protein [Cloacibacillus porcorum]